MSLIRENTSPAEILAMAYSARETLRSRARNAMREYSDRIKQCDDIMRTAATAAESAQGGVQGSLIAQPLSLSPDKQRLLVNPTHGL